MANDVTLAYSAYLDRFEGDKAVVLLGDDIKEPIKKVIFPREYIPRGITEGEYVKIAIERDDELNEAAYREAMDLRK